MRSLSINAAGDAAGNAAGDAADNAANDLLETIQQMVASDEQLNPNDDAAMWNARLRSRINNYFGKGWLTPEQANSFDVWGTNVGNLPEDASRLAIFGCAPARALYSVGF